MARQQPRRGNKTACLEEALRPWIHAHEQAHPHYEVQVHDPSAGTAYSDDPEAHWRVDMLYPLTARTQAELRCVLFVACGARARVVRCD